MTNIELNDFYAKDKYALRADLLRFLLMPFVFFVILGFPGKYGGYVSLYSNFAAPAFFILSGFFALVPDSEKRLRKIKRSLKRSAYFFIVVFVSYILLNFIYLAYIGSIEAIISQEIIRKRTFFNFLVFNIWFPIPMGSSIWFIQSLAYAYLFFFICEKLKLSKLYLPLMIVLFAVMLSVGEFAAFFGFPHFGYPYIPGGAVTRAIPYMLLGSFLRKNVSKLLKAPRYVYAIFFFVGLLAAVLEIEILRRTGKLVYTGHTVGFGIMALSICCFALKKPIMRRNILSRHGRSYSRRMYALCQPVSLIAWMVCAAVDQQLAVTIVQMGCFVHFIICFLLAYIMGMLKFTIDTEK